MKWHDVYLAGVPAESPSTRREWIEMIIYLVNSSRYSSPSTRREWIEIHFADTRIALRLVSLHTEGVD